MRTALALAVLMATPAGADPIALPKGCAAAFTVQAADCSVRTMWRCDGDAPGEMRVTRYGPEGPILDARYDADFVPLERVNHANGTITRIGEITDRFNFGRVLTEGRDSYAYSELQEPSLELQIWGSMVLTGETVTIDGRPMQRITGQRWIMAPGENPFELQEESFHDAELAFLFGGTNRFPGIDDPVVDSSPVDVILPGEAGFMSDQPLHGCPQ